MNIKESCFSSLLEVNHSYLDVVVGFPSVIGVANPIIATISLARSLYQTVPTIFA